MLSKPKLLAAAIGLMLAAIVLQLLCGDIAATRLVLSAVLVTMALFFCVEPEGGA